MYNYESGQKEQETDKVKIGAAIKNRLLKFYGDSDGKLKFSKDIEALTLSVDESGKVTVVASAGIYKVGYQLGEGLDSLGLKVPGAELKLSNFSKNGLKWSITVPKSFLGIQFKGTYSDTINFDPIGAARNGLLKDYYDKAHDPCSAYENSGC